MNTLQKAIARELLLEQMLQDSHPAPVTSWLKLDEFKKSLRKLAPDYEVLILTPSQPLQSLSGRPVQLCVTPLKQRVRAPFQIRISGTFSFEGRLPGQIDFRPASISISSTKGAPSHDEFRSETESANDVIAHVHHILSILRHDEQSKVVLSA